MRAITQSEHQKNIQRFEKMLIRLNTDPLAHDFSLNVGELQALYEEYQQQIIRLRSVMRQYRTKTVELNEDFKKRNKREPGTRRMLLHKPS